MIARGSNDVFIIIIIIILMRGWGEMTENTT